MSWDWVLGKVVLCQCCSAEVPREEALLCDWPHAKTPVVSRRELQDFSESYSESTCSRIVCPACATSATHVVAGEGDFCPTCSKRYDEWVAWLQERPNRPQADLSRLLGRH